MGRLSRGFDNEYNGNTLFYTGVVKRQFEKINNGVTDIFFTSLRNRVDCSTATRPGYVERSGQNKVGVGGMGNSVICRGFT